MLFNIIIYSINMENCDETSLLQELTYDSHNLVLLFQREKNKLKQIYGNKWLLCTIEHGKLKVIEQCDNKGELEELGFKLNANKIFDVLNPFIYTNYKNHYSTNHQFLKISGL
jgi:hypothetical protein